MNGLTARGVRTMLTRSGVEHWALTITGRSVWSYRLGAMLHEVVIEGPRGVRREAARVLYDRGLTCAPYPDHDVWSRRRMRAYENSRAGRAGARG